MKLVKQSDNLVMDVADNIDRLQTYNGLEGVIRVWNNDGKMNYYIETPDRDTYIIETPTTAIPEDFRSYGYYYDNGVWTPRFTPSGDTINV